jgi:hypothetical protein
MLHETPFYCPECDEGLPLAPPRSRREFLRALGGAAALAALAGPVPRLGAEEGAAKLRPAEELVRELFSTFSPEQKSELVLPYDHGTEGHPTRKRTFNAPVLGANKRIADTYTKPQQELIRRIVRAILADDEAFERLSRYGKWDSSGSLEGCGAVLFGEPGAKQPFAWVFSGHHVTLRCDGNSEPGIAWGGPIYYGHSEPGYSKKNVYYYQTEQVQAVFDALDSEQRAKALGSKNPGDGLNGLKALKPPHGIAYRDLTPEQKGLVENVMRTLLAPFRKEDVEEVMSIVKANGGMDYVHLAFYRDSAAEGKQQWSFWRLEGPGFVWNYRPLPHVHCFVQVLES